MRIAYLDCASGISGDMMLGALVDAGVELQAIAAGIDSLGLPGVRLAAKPVWKCGFRATQITVECPPEHAHRHLHQILKMIADSRLSPRQQELAARIFQRLGEAEAKVHGIGIEEVHFHEVGAADSIADICGAAIGWDLLDVERIVASPVPTGTGSVEIAHGRCSIPTPATAELLLGVPIAESHVRRELTTPTGAAILAAMVDSFGPLPGMTVSQIGCGAGQMDLAEQPNLLRLLVGTVAANLEQDVVWVLETNLDDTSGELIGYTTGRLLDAGALDVYTTAIQMKKNRPGLTLTVLARQSDVDRFQEILFRETNTLGIRSWSAGRQKLRRALHSVETAWGQVAGKLSFVPGRPPAFSPEYDVCQEIAREYDLPLKDVFQAALGAFDPQVIERALHRHAHDHGHDHDHSHDHDHGHDHDHD